MSDVESFDFDSLELIEFPFTVGGVKYVLREADEEAATEFRNARLKGATLKDGEAVGLPDDIAGVQSLLLSRCTFRCDEEGKPFSSPVSRDGIKKWPSRIVKPLFEKVKEISELNEDEGTLKDLLKQRKELDERIAEMQEEDAAKNEQSDTTTGSD